MNKVEALKSERDGLDVLPDLLRYAASNTPIVDIPEDDLQRMKWYGLFHRPQKPGTFMLRLRITGGRMTAAQAVVLATIAGEFGGGSADITTRANLQLRDISLGDVPAIFAALAAAGIEHRQTGMDNVRNIVGCPLAGVDGLELFDATTVVDALAEAHLMAGKRFSNLPRKFNLSVSGCRDDCGHAQTQDLALVPATAYRDGRRLAGFNVLAGGALGGTSPRLATPLDVFLLPADAVAFFIAVLETFRDHGPRDVRTKVRLKRLITEWGEERFRAEIEARLGRPLDRAGIDERLTVSGDHLGIRPQRQVGRSYVGLHVPVGRIRASQLAALAHIAGTYGDGNVNLTADQNVIITGVADDSLPALLQEPLLRELRPNPPAVWRGLVACTGNDYCHYSLIDTKRHAIELATEIERRGIDVQPGTRIHLSGCIHACGKHHVADIGLQGAAVRVEGEVVEAAEIFLGGRLGADPRLGEKTGERVVISELADAVERHLLAGRAEVGALT